MVYCSICVKILANTQSICSVFALLEQKPSLCKIFDLKARRFWMIFVLLGRRNALCLARHNRAKRAKISRFQACSDRSLYPNEKMPPLPAAFRMCNYLLSLVLSHFWFAIPQLVLQADWQDVWHSPQPPHLALSQRFLVSKVWIRFISVFLPKVKFLIIISRRAKKIKIYI